MLNDEDRAMVIARVKLLVDDEARARVLVDQAADVLDRIADQPRAQAVAILSLVLHSVGAHTTPAFEAKVTRMRASMDGGA